MNHEPHCGSLGPCGDLDSRHWPLSLPEGGFPRGDSVTLVLGTMMFVIALTVQCPHIGITFNVQWEDRLEN